MTSTFVQRVKRTASDLQPYAEEVLNEIVEAAETVGHATKESVTPRQEKSRLSSMRPSRDIMSRRRRSQSPLSDHQARLIEKTRESVGKAADTISDSVDVKHLASEVARGIVQIQNEAKRLEHQSGGGHRLGSVSEHARASTARTREAAVTTSKDFVGLVTWSGIAGVIVYKSLLDAERREAVRRALRSGLSGGRSVIRRLRNDATS